MNYTEKKLTSRELYRGKIIRLECDTVELPNGNTSVREVVRHNGGVCVLPLDEQGNALFVRQFRYPYAEELLELPAGKLEPGEDPAACGMRELEEETGHAAGEFHFLAKVYPTPGYVDEILHLYLARKLVATAQKLDEDEFLTWERIPFDQAVEYCLNGTIRDAKTIIAILQYNELRRREKDWLAGANERKP